MDYKKVVAFLHSIRPDSKKNIKHFQYIWTEWQMVYEPWIQMLDLIQEHNTNVPAVTRLRMEEPRKCSVILKKRESVAIQDFPDGGRRPLGLGCNHTLY